jgi:hypothetical protein
MKYFTGIYEGENWEEIVASILHRREHGWICNFAFTLAYSWKALSLQIIQTHTAQ